MLAARIRVVGIVQGVGFRPFVYRLAVSKGLKGYVRNLGGSEVEIYVEGTKSAIESFLEDLKAKKPAPALIEEVEVEYVKPIGCEKFEIKPSGKLKSRFSMIPPDLAICDDCLREVLDPRTRWYRYPFNSCAWCGPRYSMMYDVPYDRCNTSMNAFPLCGECRREYEDPNNIRRFHAQGISCPRCGPRVWLVDKNGERVECEDPILEAAKLVDEGYIVAIKGLGGFHLAALATDDSVVAELRKRKRRPQKPFAIMALNVEVVERIAEVTDEAKAILRSPERPIVLLPKKEGSPLSELVAPGLSHVGVMTAYTALHYLLLEVTRDKFLIMTSGNSHGKPICTKNEEALAKLRGIADYFLLHNREIVHRVDDSVARFTAGDLVLIRRARGYAPTWFRVPFEYHKPVVALGAELQNAAALAVEDKIIVAQYFGDMDEYENLKFLEETMDFLVKAYSINLKDAIIVHDKHPAYSTTKLARELSEKSGAEIVAVQHHVAHIASAMASHKDSSAAVGIAIDGLGYGDDATVWGGEVIAIVPGEGYERVGRLELVPMPGGDRAVDYPARMLIGFLFKALGPRKASSLVDKLGLASMLPYGDLEAKIALQQCTRSPMTSSLGRALDAAAALLGICWRRTYEGEPAMKLEAKGLKGALIKGVEAPITNSGGLLEVKTTELFKQTLDLMENYSVSDVARTFQYALARALAEIAIEVAREYKVKRIYVSGGAAVNEIITSCIRSVAESEGLEVRLPRRIPAGDGGICLGQAYALRLLPLL